MKQLEDVIYFDKTQPMLKIIKNYIINQCSNVCREEIRAETVKDSFTDFDFGYIRKTVRAVTGIRNFRKEQKEIVHSFILCKYENNKNGKQVSIDIQLLCNSKNNSNHTKDGVNLLKLVESKARDEGIDVLTLFSLGKPGLKRWYLKQGFDVLRELTIPSSKKIKVYAMKKEL